MWGLTRQTAQASSSSYDLVQLQQAAYHISTGALSPSSIDSAERTDEHDAWSTGGLELLGREERWPYCNSLGINSPCQTYRLDRNITASHDRRMQYVARTTLLLILPEPREAW